MTHIHLNVIEQGSGPAIVLLHGFPDFHRTWRLQVPALTAAGFRTITPDLRGYNESDKPARVADYDVDILANDVADLITRSNAAPAVLVGHDWGGVIAWRVAQTRPELLDKLIVINSPHPALYRRELRRWAQLKKAWYVLFFQLPWLPERMLRADDFGFIERAYRKLNFTDDEIREYKRAFDRPNGLTAPLNYYRAAGRRILSGQRVSNPRINVETLVIWGMQDLALEPSLLDGLEKHVTRLRVERMPNAGHWVHLQDAERVNKLMLDFLS